MTQADAAKLRESFQKIVADLLNETDASRTTIRINLPTLGVDMTKPIVEARKPGVVSLLDKVRTDQDKSGTLNFLKRERRLLLQEDCRNPDPGAIFPPHLLDEYRVLAQMMGGLFVNGELIGFVSVHESRGTRHWTEEEAGALTRAVERTLDVIGHVAR
jgi:GAF domain-containing protein